MSNRQRRLGVRRSRRGMTLLEAGVALLVMSAAILAVLELVNVGNRERRARWQRQVALMEVANQAERIALLDWEETAPDRLTAWEPSEMLRRELSSPTCTLNVQAEEQQSTARRIRIAVSWKNSAGDTVRPATVTVWKFTDGDAP